MTDTPPLDVLQAAGLVNAADLIAAAELERVPLYIAVAFAVKESGGRNVYGHDKGGAMFGVDPVTEANFAEFLALLAAGATSNGVGPLQITWPGFFPDAAKRGLRLWVPFDNFRYGLSLIRGYLKDESDESIVYAGTRYNGAAAYGLSLLPIARQWQTLLNPVPAPEPPPVVVPHPPPPPPPPPIGESPMKPMQNTAYEALLRARSFERYAPKGMCARYVSDALSNGALDVGIASAADAWNQATQKEYDRSPPAGAPVYWSVAGSRWGHIAISVGRRDNIPYVRSTDFPANERVGECTLAQMEQRWPGMVYLGWSRTLAGRTILGLEKAQPKPETAPGNGNTSTPPNVTPKPEENNMANFTPQQIEDLAGRGVHQQSLGGAKTTNAAGQVIPLTFAIALDRIYKNADSSARDVKALTLAVAALTAKVDALSKAPTQP